jgi:vitamin B12 transporter
MSRIVGMAAAVLWLAVVAAAAQEPERVDPVVITATKVETPASRVGASVTVITEDELETYNYERIEDALRQVPGVEVQRSGSPGKATTIRIRGANPNQVQIMVDGMRVKGPTAGIGDLSELTLDAIDRIEVVRGPQSSLHGADAVGGVVNIITKKGRGPVRATVHTEAGNYDTFRQRVEVTGAVEAFNFTLSGSRLDSSGQFDNDDTRQTAFAGRVGYDFPWKGELSLTGRFAHLALGLPIHDVDPIVFDPNAESRTRTWLYNVTYTQPVTRWWDLTVRHGQWWNQLLFRDDPPPPPPFTTFPDTRIRSHIDTRRSEFETVNAFHLARWTTLTVGAEHRAERGSGRGEFRESIDTVSVFAQDELRLFDRLFITGGARWEDNNRFGSEVVPQVSAAFNVAETGTRLRGAWGRGFRAPTINDLFFPGFGNPNLKPEKSESWEAGLDQRLLKNRVRVGATYFHNDFDDLILFVFDPVTFLFAPDNVGRARTRGVEVYGEVEPVAWLLLYANYTYTDTEDLDTGLELRRFARHRWNAGASVTPVERLTLFAQASVVSSQFEGEFTPRNPGYYRVDVGGHLRLLGRTGWLEQLDLTLRINNLTDQRYTEVLGFPALGINALAGLRAQLQ